MYNGQLVKGLAHVFIFAILVSLSHSAGIFGIFIAAWVIYQIFDAFHTAKARRDGLPLPDPFGLNDLGYRLGLYPNATVPPPRPGVPTEPPAAAYTSPGNPAAGAPGAGFVPPVAPPYTGAPPYAPGAQQTYGVPPAYVYDPAAPVPPLSQSSDLPTGAIILIALGVLFLFGTLGIFNGDWVGRGWPIIIIALGAWLFVRRSREARAQESIRTNGPAAGGGIR